MSLEIRRVVSLVVADGSDVVEGTVATAHGDTGWKDIFGASIATDNVGEQKLAFLVGNRNGGLTNLSYQLPFLVTRNDAENPDYAVEEGASSWANAEDESIEVRIIADGDNGWKIQARDTDGLAGNIDWNYRIETKQTFGI